MSKHRERPGGDFDDVELFFDPEFEPETFIEAMDHESTAMHRRAAWQRVEEWRDARALRAQLADWDDWEEVDSGF